MAKWVGASVRRKEDLPFLMGRGRFVDDIDFEAMLHAVILRSPYAHARIIRVDSSDIINAPGVHAVITGEDAKRLTKPIPAYSITNLPLLEYCLAYGKVRYVGEPVLALAACEKGLAEDMLDLARVEYQPLPPVVDPEKATEPDSAPLYDEYGSNLVSHFRARWGDTDKAFKEADVTVRRKLNLHRYSSTPLETIGCVASYNLASRELTIWSNTQMVGHVIPHIGDSLGIPSHKIRFVVNDIGGGFGIKTRPYKPLLICSLLAIKSGRPVKYVEDRLEHLQASGHAANGIFELEVAAKRDGTILGFRLKDLIDDGASLHYAGTYISMHATLMNGCYRIPNIEWDAYTALTNKCPTMPNRAVGQPGICYIVERMVNAVCQELGLDPTQVRFRNFIQPSEFPYVTATGRVYDSGNYGENLRKALEVSYYEKLRQEQRLAREEGRYIGIGIATFVHGSSGAMREIEGTTICVDPYGKIIVLPGSPDMGTGHATVLSQIVAEELGATPDDVTVTMFDSYANPWTPCSGTHANKFSGPDVESAIFAVKKLETKILRIASHLLRAASEDLVLNDGMVIHQKDRGKKVSLLEIARFAYQNPAYLPVGLEPGLTETYIGNNPKAIEAFVDDEKYKVGHIHQAVTGIGSPTSNMTYGSSAHIAVVEVDIETGATKILRYVDVHDCGRIVNPMIVEGQVHGASHHGIAASLLEEIIYDEEGKLLTYTFADYLKPTAVEVPLIESYGLETPSPRSSLGMKGIGEGEALAPLASMANAIEDALSPFRVQVDDLPITPEKVIAAIRKAKSQKRLNGTLAKSER